MRVIGGSARGRRLQAPAGRTTRPTSDRVREAMFSSLAYDVSDAVVLDLFAGTGALGIEALSRGAASATFVEVNTTIAATLRRNIATAGVADRASVVVADAAAFVARPAQQRFSMVLCDPPYSHPLRDIVDLVVALNASGGVADEAVVVVERDRRDPALAGDAALPDLHGLLALDRRRSYGDTVLLYLRAAAPPGGHQ